MESTLRSRYGKVPTAPLYGKSLFDDDYESDGEEKSVLSRVREAVSYGRAKRNTNRALRAYRGSGYQDHAAMHAFSHANDAEMAHPGHARSEARRLARGNKPSKLRIIKDTVKSPSFRLGLGTALATQGVAHIVQHFMKGAEDAFDGLEEKDLDFILDTFEEKGILGHITGAYRRADHENIQQAFHHEDMAKFHHGEAQKAKAAGNMELHAHHMAEFHAHVYQQRMHEGAQGYRGKDYEDDLDPDEKGISSIAHLVEPPKPRKRPRPLGGMAEAVKPSMTTHMKSDEGDVEVKEFTIDLGELEAMRQLAAE
jgi:hypothetical protein